MEITLGQSVLTGKVGGVWSKETKSFEVNRGTSGAGNRWQSFEIQVSTKKDDVWINGKGHKVMLIGDTKVEKGQMIGLVGNWKADNYVNAEGKEVKGNMFLSSEIFTPKEKEPRPEFKAQEAKPKAKDEAPFEVDVW
jgi:hypothetical protein